MRILLVGGGSGGHVTPLVAIARELHYLKPQNTQIRLWTDKKFAKQTCQLAPKFAEVEIIASGKLRRYANLNFFYKYFSWYHITHTHLPNLRDIFKIAFGFAQSFAKLRSWRPDVIFCKGGYVCLPVGLAAHCLKIPLVIHDSDTVPGLTNRVLARFAIAIGTGAPVENYPNYPSAITRFVGIPVRPEFAKLSSREREANKRKLGLDPAKKLIFVAGGGGGATIFSSIFAKIAPDIIKKFDVQIFLLTGKGKGFAVSDLVKSGPSSLRNDIEHNFIVREFLADEYPQLLNACDVFVTRAGATSMAEAAASETATIIVPSPFLAGDHQTKNAAIFAKADAAIVLKQNQTDDHFDDKLAREMSENLESLLGDRGDKLRLKLGENLANFAKKDALENIANMIIAAATTKEKL